MAFRPLPDFASKAFFIAFKIAKVSNNGLCELRWESLRKRPVVLFSWLVPLFSLRLYQSQLHKKKKKRRKVWKFNLKHLHVKSSHYLQAPDRRRSGAREHVVWQTWFLAGLCSGQQSGVW